MKKIQISNNHFSPFFHHIGIIMTAFTVCWLPFFILAVLRPFSSSIMQIPRYVNSIALWLGYVNSVSVNFFSFFYQNDFVSLYITFAYIHGNHELSLSLLLLSLTENRFHSSKGTKHVNKWMIMIIGQSYIHMCKRFIIHNI